MIRIGILGSDSSHTETYIAFANLPGAPHYNRAQVVKLWGADLESAKKMTPAGIEIVDSPQEAVTDVDLVMVCSRWGEDHFSLARIALETGVPTYIDKPLTNSLAEALTLASLANEKGVPAFSCSPFRYASELIELCDRRSALGEFRTGVVVGLSEWLALGPRAQNIYFYGVHPVEVLHTVFGGGFESVRVDSRPHADLATVRYKDGRLVGLHLLRESKEVYYFAYYGANGWLANSINLSGPFYEATLNAIIGMAESGKPPIPIWHAVESIALLDGIDRARRQSGWVSLEWQQP